MGSMNLIGTVTTIVVVIIIVTAVFGFLQTYQTADERRAAFWPFVVSLVISLLIIAGIYWVLTKFVVVQAIDGSDNGENGFWSGAKKTLNDNAERRAVGQAAYDKAYHSALGNGETKASAKRKGDMAKDIAVGDVKAQQRMDKDPSRYGGAKARA